MDSYNMFKKSVQQQLLSHHYSGNTKQLKNNKLNLFGKAIALLDTIPLAGQLLSHIQEVDLSHNVIYEIQDIQQFSNAQFINLSHNRILDAAEIFKLRKLKKLHTLYLKGNPFLRSKINTVTLSFLLSLSTDVELCSGEVSSGIQTYCLRTIQNDYFQHYLGKIEIHLQLANNYQLDESFLNPSFAIFPKVKKVFQQLAKESNFKRQLISRIPQKYFEDEKLLLAFIKERVGQAQNRRSQIIKKIYEREELLRNVRLTYRQRVVPKRIAARNMSTAGGIGVSHYSPPRANQFSPPKLKESTKQSKVVVAKVSRKMEEKQNSPVRSSDLVGQNQQIFLNALIKLNPLYHLLHSPLASLKSHEKELLIQNLCLHLRQKFKELYKYEKKEQEYLRAKEESSSLEEHLREVSLEMKDEQQKTNSKLKKLSVICQQESERVESLCQELNQCKSQLSEIRNKNIQLKMENDKFKQAIAKIQYEQQTQQTIRERRMNNLRRRILYKLSHKAYHFSQLGMLQEINRKVQQKQIKENAFHNLRLAVCLSKGESTLRSSIVIRHLHSFMQNVKNIRQQQKLRQKVQENIVRTKKQSTLKLLKADFLKQKHYKQKTQKLQKKIHKRTKSLIFNALKQQMVQKNEEQEWLELQHFSKIIAMRKYLRIWGKYIRQMQDKTQICKMQLHSQRKAQTVSLFVSKCRKQLNYRSAIMATDSFLAHIRMINGYLKFSKTVGSTLSSRKSKRRKIELIRQHQYLYWFISTIRDCQIKKRILVEREMQVRKRREEEQKKKFKNNKTNRLSTFVSFIRQAKVKVIQTILNRERKWMKLSDQRQGSQMKHFISNLRSNWICRFKLTAKSQLMKQSVIVRRKVCIFLDKLKARRVEINKFRSTLKRDRLVKCFYRWKCFSLWEKMQAYKSKFLELQPQITQVSHMQREAEKSKELLLLQMQEKELMVRDYQKKCEEYEYMLHSKDLKYDKLRQIYSDSMQQQEVTATVKLEEETQRYLGELKGRYSFKTKINEEDNYLKTYAENYKAELGRETVQRGLKSRDSFISSFKRF